MILKLLFMSNFWKIQNTEKDTRKELMLGAWQHLKDEEKEKNQFLLIRLVHKKKLLVRVRSIRFEDFGAFWDI